MVEARRLLNDYPGVTPLLLLKALSIAQLDDAHSTIAPWGEEREALELAAEVDPLSTSALVELASYLFASEGNSEEALKLFKKSVALSKERLLRSYVGTVRSLMDVAESDENDADRIAEGRATAKIVLDEATELFPDDEELEEIRDYYKLF